MKDWKSDLLAIKNLPEQNDKSLHDNHRPEEKTKASSSTFIKPLELEKKILLIIRKIESLNTSLEEVSPFPLVKGNSKKIKQYQNEIKQLKTEFTNLSYKFKPSLISGNKVPNTNALIIEMKHELLEREDRYQKMLLDEISIERERKQKEQELLLEEEKKERQRVKDVLTKKALSIIKEYKIDICNKCSDGSIYSLCDDCFGTKRLSTPREGLITERFSCANLKPTCQFCGGLGFFSKQKKGMTYECNKCVDGKIKSQCPSCMGAQISIHAKGTISKPDLLNELKSNLEILKEIQKFVGLK
jgi:hypothetical protein